MSNWQKIFESSTPVRAEIVKGVLEENGITAVIVNKKDPVYKIHGNIEVMVLAEEAPRALNIVENEISF
ncbi:putative signal transducing protein [Cyclobacterium qasimii]|uniref:DUF2007 domain-containing protein n=2 Tax=Cyclobacterium qasimii TaxID=1350429 RepID=S7VDR1_9BACT|nr:DUF2007 domain-containing protein [Cyclobacterium qasimii]EPR68390.1 hypothetical protein ADICYQ_2586 [Cyclobacterium qasimii M12-11B]GEO24156.1 hypothetical protein CQA01_46900 [Cyclobacterium qasimii]